MKVVFDFAGVLFRWHPPSMVARVLPRRAPDAASAGRLVRAIFQGYGGDWDAFDRGTVEVAALVAQIAARTGLQPHEVRAVVDEVPRELQPIPETVALVHELHGEGVPLHFLSNMPAPYADHLDAAHAVIGCFTSGLYSGRERLVKPEPAIYALAAERFGAAPSELLFFDDVPANVDAAREAGWRAEVFVDAAGARQVLAAAGIVGG